jgi:hypothetical protein
MAAHSAAQNRAIQTAGALIRGNAAAAAAAGVAAPIGNQHETCRAAGALVGLPLEAVHTLVMAF